MSEMLVKELNGRWAAGLALACLLAAACCSCSSRADSAGDETRREHAAPAPSSAAPAEGPASRAAGSTKAPGALPGVTFINYTGTAIRAIYISSHDSAGWEENVLGRDELADGDTLDVRFSPEERTIMWDVRAESTDGYVAEWKNLNLYEISRLTLRINLDERAEVVAEAE